MELMFAALAALLMVLGGLFGATVSRLLSDEFRARAPWLIERLICLAVRRLPARYRNRLSEEWRSHIAEVRSDIGKLIVACDFIRASRAIRYGVIPAFDRSFVAAALMATIVLVGTGVVLTSVYRNSVERAFDARLSAYVKMLMVNFVSVGKPLKVVPQSIGETLFELPLSGWYWQVTALDVSKPESRSSRSLWDTTLTSLRGDDATTSPDGARHGYAIGPEGQRLRLIERTIDLGDDGRYLIAVAGDALEIDDQMRFFQEAIAASFGFLVTLLALLMYFHSRIVRKPSGAA